MSNDSSCQHANSKASRLAGLEKPSTRHSWQLAAALRADFATKLLNSVYSRTRVGDIVWQADIDALGSTDGVTLWHVVNVWW